jgi:hypothetical protein
MLARGHEGVSDTIAPGCSLCGLQRPRPDLDDVFIESAGLVSRLLLMHWWNIGAAGATPATPFASDDEREALLIGIVVAD